mmetsp:Transcript_20976/g.29609  ORF Transcript_20976/g.29609 Transcript_20976/m.29609 type:complete len:748 (-) Transcript_20976:145-2388(-)
MTEADIAAGGGTGAVAAGKTGDKNKVSTMTKRQKIKAGPNPSNTWPQMPKIQSPAARAKAYLRVAGFGASKGKKAAALDPSLDLNSPELKFGRQLAGTEERKRHEAVDKLERYIKARCDIRNETGGFSELDLLRLWKGLWYTLFLADKVPVQDELSKRLTELIWCVAGTEEEDEYAGQAYMDLYGDDTQGGFEGEEEEDDSEDVTMEEIHNSLRKHAAEEKEEDSDGSLEEVELVGSDEEKEILGRDDDSESDQDEEEEEEEDDINIEEEEKEEVDDMLVPHCRGAHLASLFVKTFFQTVRREWDKMDKHRVDKFYTLVRLMMKQVYKYMAMRHWNIGIIRLFNDTIFEQVLSQTPNGLRFHLIDLCLEELVLVNITAPMPLTEATFLDCLEPYFAMAQTVPETVVHNRVMEKIFQSFLDDYSIVSDTALQSGEDDEDVRVFEEVHVGSVAQFIFELASDTETFDKYRKTLYSMHKTYMKRLKKVGKDVEMEGEKDVKEDSGDGEFVAAPEIMYDADAEHTEEEHAEEFEESPPPKKKSSEKKKKKKRKAKDEPVEEFEEEKPKDEEASSVKKSEKKKKKKARKSVSPKIDEPEEIQAAEPPEEEVKNVSTVKKKKKDKKKGKKHKTSPDGDAEEPEEDVITISVREQKTAARAGSASKNTPLTTPQKNKKSSKGSSSKTNESTTDKKRVSFGKVNHSKSYKASIKGLKTATPSTDKTPEKGILLKREVVSTTGKRLRKKKKALDYF